MQKRIHEIRDPIHVFIRLDSDERKVLDSRPFQRLRHIHQLGLCYLVYPGATHRRFEHSLGVMELANRVFDVVTNGDCVKDDVRETLPEIANEDQRNYWRRVLRMAALCHDLGHLPFSHSAERDLLPKGWNHERLTRQMILSPEMSEIWNSMTPPLRAEHIVKLAVGPRESVGLSFSNWEGVLSDIIVGDAFGVDRMDYLLRDSHHAGVAYGRFDHHRLIDTLRILQSPPVGRKDVPTEPALGVEEGGLRSAEALLLARYFMYSQLYYHPIRLIYDVHLKDFLAAWLPKGRFPTRVKAFLRLTDNEVTSALHSAAASASRTGHDAAKAIVHHEHFKVLYRRRPDDLARNPEASHAVFKAAKKRFGGACIRYAKRTGEGGAVEFPVLMPDERVAWATSLSEVLRRLPVAAADYVFVSAEKKEKALQWLDQKRDIIVELRTEGKA